MVSLKSNSYILEEETPLSNLSKPRFLYNDYNDNMKLSYELEQLLKECDTFLISVAFVNESGLAAIKETILELRKNNKKGKIITSTYLGFNEPKVFKELLNYPNIEVRIFEGEYGFHPKGYIFKKDGYYKAIIGSSNFTQSALLKNQEWNLFFSSTENGEVIQDILREFDKQWELSTKLTNQWILEYEKDYQKPSFYNKVKKDKIIEPNYMQQEALLSLSSLRKENKDKALLISATGTGKTYLAAFDVQAVNPKKMLFVVHRRTIALKAMETFQNIIKNKTMGIFSGSKKELDKDYIFSTIQTIYKAENRELFSKNEFDYVVIDEVHKAGANSYQEFINYFKPKFLLGMSATPERTDGFDIYKTFDYNIAFEIRLQQAMEYDLLCPFHYYGISDITINGKVINDKSDFNTLTSEDRVNYIIEKINDYGYSGNKVHGLVFCSRKDEATELSSIFNMRGYKTLALTGDDNEETRQNAMERLESNDDDYLDYIFTVDIFNEGIDIPSVNQVIMLRPTTSSIIFVQQLGRGLRKSNNKEYVIVIDFIANYEKNFLIPIALSGNTNLDKDNLRRFMCEGNLMLPGVSTIQFDEISKTRIFESIDQASFNNVSYIKDSYFSLKAKIGRIPKIKDFETYGAIDIQRIFLNNNLGSYHEFLKKYEDDYHVSFSELEESYLKFVSIKLSSGKRIQELELIKLAILKRMNLIKVFKEKMLEEYEIPVSEYNFESIEKILTQNFATGASKNTYKDITIIDNEWNISPVFNKLLYNETFKEQILEIIEYGVDMYKKDYANRYQGTDLCLYKKYTYEDVCRLLNWEKSLVPLNMGGYFYDERTNTLPVFINYDKEETISETTKYNDHFIDQENLVAISKSNKRLDGKGMKMFTEANVRGTIIHIFVRKNKDDATSKEFYYLGEGKIVDIIQDNMENDVPICEILYRLDQPVKKDIYDYLIN